MVLKELISRLKQEPKEKIIKNGFSHSMSYRGDYNQLAFEPAENVTVGSMLENAESSLFETFEGYKGGDFKMDEYTRVYLAKYGCTGDEIGTLLLNYMLADVVPA